ncbi:MAG: hypothetical protein ACHP9X_06230 [Steroidobacterales bacterium]
MTALWATESEIALLRQDLNQYRAANKSDIALLRQDVNHFRAAIKSDMELFLASMTIRFGLMLVVAVGALFTAPTLMLRWVIR